MARSKIDPRTSSTVRGKKLPSRTEDLRAPRTKPKQSGPGGVGSGSGRAGGWLGKGE